MLRNSAHPQQVWWLNPAYVAGLMGVLVSLAAYLTPGSSYMTQWKTPKYFNGDHLLMSLGFTLLFVFGALAAMKLGKSTRPVDWRSELPWDWISGAFWLCVILSVAGYVVWGGVAVARGASAQLALGVLRGEKGAISIMKDTYLVTISGVTTLTQLGIPAMVLGVLMGTTQGWRKVAAPVGLVLFLALVRAMFNAERLAIIELAIPTLVLALRVTILESQRFQGRYKLMLQLVPIAAVSLLVCIFALFEYFRSWSSYYAGGDLSFWEFVVLRLEGYYVTALNNGALMVDRIDTIYAPFASLHFLWRFPFTGGLMPDIFPNIKVDNLVVDPYMQILDREANPEFNNSSALLPVVVDFGVAGAMAFWSLAGLLCGYLYRRFLDGQASGLLFYPIFFTGVTETTRIMYWGEGRAVTTFFILVPLAWFCSVWARRAYQAQRRLACL